MILRRRKKILGKYHLNNKGRLDRFIWTSFVCLFVGLFTLDLRNGATYEYEICTANSCDDTLKSEVSII